ncbi:hypothetical protein EHV15_26575 [Paenibacillus oralis]|uniref:Uncharacterized protein n=1 Tax=Paenibacillus oralis TaxID=2490856 RepID=A0A3P3U772_9BACL|nr:hypothetical protein [Paenibacillus oralis]RRJ66080.1 hypothetical protein EHV15_26575 [Paenibacillus oralis]
MNDKLSIIYEPQPYIKDPRLLTSLCIYYDNVMLFHHTDITNDYSERLDTQSEELNEFLLGPFDILSSEGFIDIYTPEKVTKLFPEINQLELAIERIDENDDGIVLRLSDSNLDDLTNSIITSLNSKIVGKPTTVKDLIRSIYLYSVAKTYNIPVLTDRKYPLNNTLAIEQKVRMVSDSLAMMTINKFALPELCTLNVEDILFSREKLKDELIEFRTGILDLTYFLCKNLDGDNLKDLHYECSLLVETKIKASIMSLEKAITKNKNSRIRNLIFNAAKLILTGGNIFLTGGGIKDIISNGASLLDISKALIDTNIPEQRIASFTYRINRILSKSNRTTGQFLKPKRTRF